jgi:23S rRNA (uracil1939-C5)-methyltransferase
MNLTVTTMAFGGEALGHHEGKVVFVPYAIPGEEVKICIEQEKKDWARAALVEISRPSKDRIAAPCPYFGPGLCGGCQWQHIAYERQLALKEEIAADQLRRIGRLSDPPVRPALAVGEPFHYRNHMQFSVAPDGRLGLLRAQSHSVIPIDECPLLHPLLGVLYHALAAGDRNLRRVIVRGGVESGDRMVILEGRRGKPPTLDLALPVSVVLHVPGKPPLVRRGSPFIQERVLERTFRISPESFFQVNTKGAEALVRLVREFLAPDGRGTLLDLYCGVGLFGLSLAGEVERVVAIDESASAIEDSAFNARGLSNVTLEGGDVAEVLGRLGGPVQRVVLDPPRSGVGREVLKALSRLEAGRIAYVSCDPATLARDGAFLAGLGYRLEAVQPVDLFPQTYHIETVSLWVR